MARKKFPPPDKSPKKKRLTHEEKCLRKKKKKERLAATRDPANEVGAAVIKKKRKFRAGTVALREIRKYQKSTEYLIQKAPFKRLVKEVGQEQKAGLRFKKTAILAIQEATEEFITSLFANSLKLALHAKRVTMTRQDLQLAVEFYKQYTHT